MMSVDLLSLPVILTAFAWMILGFAAGIVYLHVRTRVIAATIPVVIPPTPKRVKDGHQETETNLRTLLDATTDSIILHDMSGRIEIANKVAARQLSQDFASIIGMNIFDCLPKDACQSRRYWFDRLLTTNKSVRFEESWSGKRFDTTLLPVSNSHRLHTGIAMFSRDITAERNYQEALAQAKDDAEQASTAKTRFLAAASHDLRQPIQAMNMFIDLLDRRTDSVPEQEYVDSMKLSLAVLANLLNTLLDISKLDADMVQPEPQVLSANDILDRMRAQFQPVADASGVHLVVAPSTLAIWGDLFLIERVMNNLVANALSFANGGKVLIGCRRTPSHVRMQVWDTGIGIEPENLSQIFEEFYQVANPERDRRKGLGLGLSIVRRLTDLMGLAIRVESEPHHGTMFEIYIPQASQVFSSKGRNDDRCANNLKPATLTSPLRQEGVTEGLLVLTIDDEPTVLRGLTLMLTDGHFDVASGVSAEAAVADLRHRFGDRIPDLVIADYRLSHGFTGPQAIDWVSSALKTQVPGIILTGDTSPERLQEARQSGYPVLHKPLSADQVLMEIEHILQKDSAVNVG